MVSVVLALSLAANPTDLASLVGAEFATEELNRRMARDQDLVAATHRATETLN